MGKRVDAKRTPTEPPPTVESVAIRKRWILIFVLPVALVAVGFASGQFNRRGNLTRLSSTVHSFRVINTFPHDEGAFSQGLDFDGTTLFESTGQYGKSTIRRVNLKTGKVEKQLNLDKRLFGEGLTLLDDKVVQLTWKQGLGYVYDAKTLKLLETFRYRGEGWGITYDGTHLIMSNGTDRLQFLDPKTYSVVKTLRVKDRGRSVSDLNELEFVEGEVLANVWYSNRIAVISPETGKVNSWIDLSDLPNRPLDPEAVLNGIAYGDGRLFVTGKNWPKLFEIEVVKKKRESPR